MKRLTNEQFVKRVKTVKPNITVLSDYVNTRTDVYVKCNICNYRWYVIASTLIHRDCGCPKCAGVPKITLDDLVLEVSNFHKSLELESYDLINSTYIKSKSEIILKCKICNSTFVTSYNRLHSQKSGCAVCLGKKVLKGYNDLWTTHADIAKLLDDPNDGYKYTYGSNKRVDWKCEVCNKKIKNKSILMTVCNGVSCVKCSDGISFPEKVFSNVLDFIQVEYIKGLNKSKFEWCDNYIYDFYIPKLNCIVETHGEQHYTDKSSKGRYSKTLEEEQLNDNLKEHLASNNNVKYYIVLDCRKSKIEWIKKSIMESDLPQLLGFEESDVNWQDVHKQSLKSKIKEACDYFNAGYSREYIMDKLKISSTSYNKYLNYGTQCGICHYNGLKERAKSASEHAKKQGKKVMCTTTGIIFNSIKEAGAFYDVNPTNISVYLSKNSNRKYAGINKNTNQKLTWRLL